ncbi:MAG: hypothetical protein AB7F31_05410 [Parachlamydiales bacterium]
MIPLVQTAQLLVALQQGDGKGVAQAVASLAVKTLVSNVMVEPKGLPTTDLTEAVAQIRERAAALGLELLEGDYIIRLNEGDHLVLERFLGMQDGLAVTQTYWLTFPGAESVWSGYRPGDILRLAEGDFGFGDLHFSLGLEEWGKVLA